MALHACANDNWIGWNSPRVRGAAQVSKMLASVARVRRMKQTLIDRRGDPAVQEAALAGNTIQFALTTADAPSLGPPPPTDTLLGTMTAIYTHSINDLSKAECALAGREVHLKMRNMRRPDS